MKVALVIQNADRRNGGAEQYTLDLARALTLRGHQITVVAAHGPAAVMETAQAGGYKCMYLGCKGRRRWQRLQDFLQRARQLYENGAYDIVHAMLPVWRCDVYQPHAGLATDLLATGHMKHPNRLVQRLSRVANHCNSKRVGLARIEESLMAHEPQPQVCCFSNTMMNYARTHLHAPEDHLVMLSNAIDLAKFDPAIGVRSRKAIREEWKVSDDQCLGVLVGHNFKLKGVREAIEALAGVKDSRSKIMVVGRDEPGPYRKHASRLGVGDRVIFAGTAGDPRPFYAAADYVLLPSRRDTCSLVVLEALAMGLPVITTRQNGASEVMEHGRQGLIMDRGDCPALTQAIETMLDREVRRTMAREALSMRPRLSMDHHVSMIERTYLAAAERGRVETGAL